MNITVHRGINQIGGCITEIATASSRIFIDMGDNLPGEKNLTDAEKRTFVNSLFTQKPKEYEAVFYTHAHADHIGMMNYVPDSIPQYMSRATMEHCRVKYNLLSTIYPEANLRNLQILQRANIIQPTVAVCIGDIKVKAYDVPHSAYGSVMLLIEADGKSILHTGDFKRSGIALDFIRQIKKIGQVNVVITEGTMLNRQQAIESEDGVCSEMIEVMRRHKYVFVLTSSLNADRLASVAKAAYEVGKPITVCSAMMRSAFKTYCRKYPTIFKSAPTYYPFAPGINSSLLSNPKVARLESWVSRSGFVECVGIGQFEKVRDILTSYQPEECALIYSTWSGYYTIPEQIRISPNYKALRDLFVNVYDIHSSGHADRSTLVEMLTLLNPTDGIIGIHKEAGASLTTLDLPESLKAKIIPDRNRPDFFIALEPHTGGRKAP